MRRPTRSRMADSWWRAPAPAAGVRPGRRRRRRPHARAEPVLERRGRSGAVARSRQSGHGRLTDARSRPARGGPRRRRRRRAASYCKPRTSAVSGWSRSRNRHQFTSSTWPKSVGRDCRDEMCGGAHENVKAACRGPARRRACPPKPRRRRVKRCEPCKLGRSHGSSIRDSCLTALHSAASPGATATTPCPRRCTAARRAATSSRSRTTWTR